MKSSIKTILVSVFCCVVGYIAGTHQSVKPCECNTPVPVSSVLISTPDGEPGGNDSDGIVDTGDAGEASFGGTISTTGILGTSSTGGTIWSTTTTTEVGGTGGTTTNTTSTELSVEPLMSIDEALELSSKITLLMCQ